MQQAEQPSIEALTSELNTLKGYLAHLEKNELRGNAALEAFQRVSITLTSSLDLKVVLNTILEGALALLDEAGDAHIFLYQDGRLRFGSALDHSGPSVEPLWEPRPDGLSYAVAKSGETILVPNIHEHELFANVPEDWTGGIIGQPLKIGERVVGVMNVGFPQPHEFSADDLLLLRLFGDQAAMAIENANLFGEAQRRAKLLDAVRRVNMTITASLDLRVVLETILEGTMELLTTISETHIFLYEDGVLEFGAGRSRSGLTDRPYAQPRRGGLTYNVAEQGELIAIPRIKGHPLYRNAPPEWDGAIIGLPLKVGNRVVGVMNVGYFQPQEFAPTELYVLGLLGDQAAVAIENARLYDRIRHDAEELEARVSERTAELSAYSHTVAHDLRSPLLMIMGYADLLESKYKEAMPPKAADYVERINTSSRRMADMIGQLLRLAELRDAAISAQPVDVAPRVDAAINRFQDRILERPITVDVADYLPPAMGHAIWIEEIFANLISNAIQYIGKENADCRIWVRGSVVGERVRYEVQDNGLGIPLDKQDQIFQMFSRVHPSEAKGFGLGLSIVHRIVTNLSGTLGVESDGERGSTFWFTLPAVVDG